MHKLMHDNFIKARGYIYSHADDITRAWFDYHFIDNDADKFINVLSGYQYANGGFGGLAYEFAYRGACLKCTEHAIDYMMNLNIKLPAAHPVVRKTITYLLDHYRPQIGNWGPEVVPPAVNDGVHCRWSRYRGRAFTPINDEDERIRRYDPNEKACFAAFVALYPELVTETQYRDILKYPTQHIKRYYDEASPEYNKAIFENGSPYDFEYLLLFTQCLSGADADKCASILRQNPTAFMEPDYSKSDNSYAHLPCDAAGSPDSVIYPVIKDLIDASLTHRMLQQADDGRWPLGWPLGEGEAFNKMQVLYEASRTANMLVKLKRFGRIGS